MSRIKWFFALVVALGFSPLDASWEILDLPTDRGFTEIWAIDEQQIFVGGTEGLWKTFDGNTWSLDTMGCPLDLLYFADDSLGFMTKFKIRRLLLRSNDGGLSWKAVPDSLGDTLTINFISFPKGQAQLGYAASATETTIQVLYTDNRGATWSTLPPLPDVYPGFGEILSPSDVCFPSDPDTGYVSADLLKIISYDPFEVENHSSYFKTTDGGQSWILNEEVLYNDEFKPFLVDFPENASVGYMAGGGGKLFKTTDGGETWDTVLRTPVGYPNIYDMCFPETDQVGYVLNDTMIHKTTDGGKTWRTFGLGQDTVFLRCHFLNDSLGFISGTGTTAYNSLNPYTPGFVMKTTDGLLGIAEEDWVDVEPEVIEVISSIGQQIVFNYSNCPQGLHAFIYDPCGRRVDELHSSLQSGTISWGQGKPSGVYFIHSVRSGNSRPLRVVLVQ